MTRIDLRSSARHAFTSFGYHGASTQQGSVRYIYNPATISEWMGGGVYFILSTEINEPVR